MKIIKSLLCLLMFATVISAQEKMEWRTMYFGAPSIGLRISIQNGILASKDGVFSWNGQISPYIYAKEFSNRSTPPYFEECSMELCNYAYSITERDRIAVVEKKDRSGYVFPEKIRTPKFTFSVSNDISDPDSKSYEGYITQAEFTQLLSLALRDIKKISEDAAKKRSVENPESVRDTMRKEREAMFEKKLKALTEKENK